MAQTLREPTCGCTRNHDGAGLFGVARRAALMDPISPPMSNSGALLRSSAKPDIATLMELMLTRPEQRTFVREPRLIRGIHFLYDGLKTGSERMGSKTESHFR